MGDSGNPGMPSSRLSRRTFLGGTAAVGAFGLTGGLLAGCAEGSSPSSSGSGGGSTGALKPLSVGVFQNPDSLDPGQTGLITVAQVLSTIFDTLIW
jgi:ABC-type oligopeptide transport system substrate-binding subunit